MSVITFGIQHPKNTADADFRLCNQYTPVRYLSCVFVCPDCSGILALRVHKCMCVCMFMYVCYVLSLPQIKLI